MENLQVFFKLPWLAESSGICYKIKIIRNLFFLQLSLTVAIPHWFNNLRFYLTPIIEHNISMQYVATFFLSYFFFSIYKKNMPYNGSWLGLTNETSVSGCLSMHKNQWFITVAMNIFYKIKFICKSEILKSFIYNIICIQKSLGYFFK